MTDAKAQLYQHLEYFPFGETWIEEATAKQRTPYHYTAKELDEETGLYYYGARYYDPRTSVWQSVDPILGEYLPTGDKKKDKNLPGMGGVYNSKNLAMFTYTHQNPVKLIDPDGNEVYMDSESEKLFSNILSKSETAREMFKELHKSETLYVFHIDNDTNDPKEEPAFTNPYPGKGSEGQDVVETTIRPQLLEQWEARDQNDNWYTETLESTLVHEFSHAFIIEDVGKANAGRGNNYGLATHYQNTINSEINPNATKRDESGIGRAKGHAGRKKKISP